MQTSPAGRVFEAAVALCNEAKHVALPTEVRARLELLAEALNGAADDLGIEELRVDLGAT